jgi:hypothetical protein
VGEQLPGHSISQHKGTVLSIHLIYDRIQNGLAGFGKIRKEPGPLTFRNRMNPYPFLYRTVGNTERKFNFFRITKSGSLPF